MAAKEIKALLKSARSALDKQEYEEAIRHCKAILWSDNENYLANVIAGKAHFLLESIGEAKRHYKQAATINEKELLAWKGLADLYDKYSHDGTEADISTAIAVYERVLDVMTDESRKISTTHKLALLYKRTKQTEQAGRVYQLLVELGPSLDLLREGVEFLLNEGVYSYDRWVVIKDSYLLLVEGVADDAWAGLISSYITGLMKWIKLLVMEECVVLLDHLREHCQSLLLQLDCGSGGMKKLAVETLCLIELWSLIQSSQSDYRLHPLDCHQKDLFPKGEEIGLCYSAIMLADKRKIKEASQTIEKALSGSCNVSEYWTIACFCHVMSHDYHTVVSNAKEGLKYLSNSPLFLQSTLKKILNVCMAEALVESEQFDKALEVIEKELGDIDMSHDCHVIEVYVRALIGCGNTDKAEEVVSTFVPPEGQSHIIRLLKGLILMARNDFKTATDELLKCVEVMPSSTWCLYNLGVCLMASPTGDKKQAYQYLIKAAQLDPLNPRIFLHLGHYQRNITKDLGRAIKCYQKSFTSSYAPLAAGLSLGEVYTVMKDEFSNAINAIY